MKRVARTWWAFINPLVFNFFSALSNFHSACWAIFGLVSSGKHVNKVLGGRGDRGERGKKGYRKRRRKRRKERGTVRERV